MGCGNSDRGARLARAGAAVLGCLVLANCSSSSKLTSRVDPRYGVAASPRVVEPGQPVPKGGGVYRVGKPYQVAGVTYTPEENRSYRNEGLASWYGDDFHGRLTANGEVWVCLLGGNGKQLVGGEILAAGESAGPFRSGSFTLALGNGAVTMTVDGKKQNLPEPPSPIGFAVDPRGAVSELPEGERPTCT